MTAKYDSSYVFMHLSIYFSRSHLTLFIWFSYCIILLARKYSQFVSFDTNCEISHSVVITVELCLLNMGTYIHRHICIREEANAVIKNLSVNYPYLASVVHAVQRRWCSKAPSLFKVLQSYKKTKFKHIFIQKNFSSVN